MIETYKLSTGNYDQQVALTLPKNVTGEYFTRGNCNKLLVKRCRYELQKNFLSNRIVNMWNSLHFTSLYLPRSLQNRKSSNTVQIQHSRRETVRHKMR